MKSTLRNTGNYVPVDAAYHSRRLEYSSTRLWEHQILRLLSFSLRLMQQKSSGFWLKFEFFHAFGRSPFDSKIPFTNSSLFPWCFPAKVFLYARGPKSRVLYIILISPLWFNWPGNSRCRKISTYLNFTTSSLQFRSEESNDSKAQWVPIFNFIILKLIT